MKLIISSRLVFNRIKWFIVGITLYRLGNISKSACHTDSHNTHLTKSIKAVFHMDGRVIGERLVLDGLPECFSEYSLDILELRI